MSAVRFSKLANTVFAIATAADATETALAPILVSVRTRLATENARLEQPVQHRSGRAGFLRDAVGVLQLAEDLRLAEHHRIEAGRDRERVRDGLVLDVVIQAVVQSATPSAVVALQPGAEFVAAA